MIEQMLNEAKDLSLFKRILSAFSCFVERQPGTGMNRIYKNMLDSNIGMMPKDQRALDILSNVVKDKSDSAVVQDVVNKTFTDLPCTVRPSYRNGSAKLVAFWCKGGKVYSKVFDLLNFDKSSGQGFWSNESGEKVNLLDLSSTEDN